MDKWTKIFEKKQEPAEKQQTPHNTCGVCGKMLGAPEPSLPHPTCETCGKTFCYGCAKVTMDPELTKKYGGLVILCPLCQRPIYVMGVK